MGLFGSVVQLLQNTTQSAFSSGFKTTTTLGDVLLSWTCPIGGIMKIHWHMYADPPAGALALKLNGTAIFTPATSAVADGGYQLQLIMGVRDVLTVEVVDCGGGVAYSDLIITQIG